MQKIANDVRESLEISFVVVAHPRLGYTDVSRLPTRPTYNADAGTMRRFKFELSVKVRRE